MSDIVVVSFQSGDGDCILIRCIGDQPFNILVDGGRGNAVPLIKAYLAKIPVEQRKIDVFIVTHIDADHITGALEILEDQYLCSLMHEIWFNFPGHTVSEGVTKLSVAQGDALVQKIRQLQIPWNSRFNGEAIVWHEQREQRLSLTNETDLTLFGPSVAAFESLQRHWPLKLEDLVVPNLPTGVVALGAPKAPEVLELIKRPYVRDKSFTNASSIAFVLQHRGKCILISADSHAEQLVDALQGRADGCSVFDLATVPHHGSNANFSPELAKTLKARRWLLSTDGTRHGHPSGEAIARILMALTEQEGEAILTFNSTHSQALAWDNNDLKRDYRYGTQYPKWNENWIEIIL